MTEEKLFYEEFSLKKKKKFTYLLIWLHLILVAGFLLEACKLLVAACGI